MRKWLILPILIGCLVLLYTAISQAGTDASSLARQAVVITTHSPASANYRLSANVFAAGGGVGNASIYKASSVLGQLLAIGISQSGNYKVAAGYLYAQEQEISNAVIVTIGEGIGSPGSTGNPVTISADNQSHNTTPIASAELWVVYDETIGVTVSGVNTTSRTQDFQVQMDVDRSNPSAAVAHILLFNLSGGTIQPGTGPILELLLDVDVSATWR